MALAEPPRISSTPPSGSVELRQLWQSGQRARALRGVFDNWATLLDGADDVQWLAEALRLAGLPAEAAAVDVHQARRHGAAAATRAAVIDSILRGDPWWARELLDEMGTDSRELDALRIEAALAVGDDASALIAAWAKQYPDESGREAAIDWWIRSCRIEEAERVLEQTPGADLWRARLALWRVQPHIARPILDRLPPSSDVRCLEAIADIQEERLDEAEARLRALLHENAGHAEAWSWLSMLLRKRGCFSEAVRAADAAKRASPSTNLAAQLERELAIESVQAAHRASIVTRLLRVVGLAARARRRRTIGDLDYARVLHGCGLRDDDPLSALETVLDRFGGNRSCHLTKVEAGRLKSFRLPVDPGQLGSTIRSVLWTRGADAARALFDELAPSADWHPFFHNYRGELELWMGEYQAAERIFRRVLDVNPRVKWSWIGLGASVMFQGDLREAQKIWAKGVEFTDTGPTLHVYRGECLRRQGRVAEARADLTEALTQTPGRFSARINLALLDDGADALAAVERECVARAPLLMNESQGSMPEKLEGVLAAMRGNRSSSPSLMSYHLWGRVWRLGAEP